MSFSRESGLECKFPHRVQIEKIKMKYYPPFFFLFLFFRIQDNKIKIEELAHFLANRRIPLSFHIPAENDHIIMGQFKISWKAMTLP